MLTKNDVANLALGYLGVGSTITDIDSDYSQPAKIIRRQYRHTLDYFLEQHQWNFARKTQQLDLYASDPEQAFRFAYRYPGDALVIRQISYNGHFVKGIELNYDDLPYFEEIYIGSTRLIYTNVNAAHAEFTRRIAESDTMPQHFARGLAAQLALDIAASLITNNYAKIKNLLYQECEGRVAKAIADDIVKTPQPREAEPAFVRARR